MSTVTDAERTNAMAVANAGHAAGQHRVRFADLFDAEVARHHERFLAAAGAGRRDRVLDVGCGTGQSTRDAARAAAGGSVLGVDLSAPLLELARRLTDRDGLRNVTYQLADAQLHRFPEAQFDLGISRFGTMFFAGPVAAFTNIGRALRAGGRLVLLVWQRRERNEWATAIDRALTGDPAGPAAPDSGQHPFSLGEPATAEAILTAAGFADVGFTEVAEPITYGPDVATAYEFTVGLRDSAELLARLDPAAVEPARQRLRAILAEHDTGDGVWFDARTWIITARRR